MNPKMLTTTKALTFAEIEKYLVDCTTDLLAAYRRTVELAEGGVAETPGPCVMSVVGFATKGMRGSLLLLSPRDVVLELVPPELQGSTAPVEHLLRDVLGEFANMLAGRLRNRLIAHGIDPLVSTPTTVLGDEILVPAPKSGISAWNRFVGPDINVFVRLDATFESSFTLAPPDDANAPQFHEGEMVFF
jgi:CheY-specific phosphatase CheX